MQEPPKAHNQPLLERNETRRVGGTDTRSSVLYRCAKLDVSMVISIASNGINVLRDGEFSQVVSDHFWLNFNLVELLS